MIPTFYCYSCHKHKPLAQMRLRKDVLSRTRRICSFCFDKRKEAAA